MADRLAVLTSGGDSPGMNAAVRAVVRTGLASGFEVFAVYEGLQGLVDGGEFLRPVSAADVGGIMQVGGTVLGSARSKDFRTRDGLRRAVHNLVQRGIDALVVIGGDGSLSGADELREEWPSLLQELVDSSAISPELAELHGTLDVVGLVGSIDNDMFGTDMTIGADTALHRITEAVDAIQSTASSHQRTFVIEVMGRHCGYLALMSGLATGANFVLIPENPVRDGWEEAMCSTLSGGRAIGRRANIVLVAEGARDVHGDPVTSEHVKGVLERRLGEDARVTILGHVQRGGAPSAFDRYLGTVLGHAAVVQLRGPRGGEPTVVGIRGHAITSSPLRECLATTRSIPQLIETGDVEGAMSARGGSFTNSYELLGTIVQARPRHTDDPGSLRLAVMHAGGPAPGMNAAVRVALRAGMDRGHTIVAIEDGFRGLLDGRTREMDWMSVSGWVSRSGVELGTNRFVPSEADLPQVADRLSEAGVDGLLVIGGWAGYAAAHLMASNALRDPRLGIPVVCVPASISNNLPASDLSIGSDTALNNIMADVDKIREATVAARRIFIVEVMGHECGYLALMSGLTTGAERVYIPEEGLSLEKLLVDLDALRTDFAQGKRRGLLVMGEGTDDLYTTGFIESLFAHESRGHFDVRSTILGHVQQGGSPSPFDRIQATRLASAAVGHLVEQASSAHPMSAMVGLRKGRVAFTSLSEFPFLVEPDAKRPKDQSWWMELRPVVDMMALTSGT